MGPVEALGSCDASIAGIFGNGWSETAPSVRCDTCDMYLFEMHLSWQPD